MNETNIAMYCSLILIKFRKADLGNRYKLVKAFPEFFGKEVPEFGISTKAYPAGLGCSTGNKPNKK